MFTHLQRFSLKMFSTTMKEKKISLIIAGWLDVDKPQFIKLLWYFWIRESNHLCICLILCKWTAWPVYKGYSDNAIGAKKSIASAKRLTQKSRTWAESKMWWEWRSSRGGVPECKWAERNVHWEEFTLHLAWEAKWKWEMTREKNCVRR